MMRFLMKASVFCLLMFLASCTNTLQPAEGVVTYSFSIPTVTPVRIEVENNYNTVIDTLFDRISAAGAYTVAWEPGDDIQAGIYYIKRYENDSLRDTVQLVLFERSN